MKVGFVGWRGMVGSVLVQRMLAEGDFEGIEARFFSSSSPGRPGPDVGAGSRPLLDARDVGALADNDVIVTCQGGWWTEAAYPALRGHGWAGTWIDAASTLRMHDDATLVLDPVNGDAVREAIHRGANLFVGANCTVGLLLMGLVGLLRSGQVEWVSTMTYQAASGAGARQVRELVAQMRRIGDDAADLLDDPATTVAALDRRVSATLADPSLPTEALGRPLAGSALPWIGDLGEGGQTREEQKAMDEANKLLGRTGDPLPIDGLCVRIGSMRCHANAVTMRLKSDVPLDEIEAMIREAHQWVHVVPNERDATRSHLTPAAVAGTLGVPVGRLRKMRLGPQFLTCFTVGDQLLWGAAEPLRRTLRALQER